MIETFTLPETRWLSNFAPCKITMNGIIFSSVECAYMSAKLSEDWWVEFCRNNEAKEVKKKSAEIKGKEREDWNRIKLRVMEECLRQKFSQKPYRNQLILTGNQNIQEGNFWGDEFWGVNLKELPNVGENHLGRLIMKIREELHAEEDAVLSRPTLVSDLFGNKSLPDMDMTIGQAQELIDRYGLGITMHTPDVHKLVKLIICLENENSHRK